MASDDTLRGALDRLGVAAEPMGVMIGAAPQPGLGRRIEVISPINGATLTTIMAATASQVHDAIDRAVEAFPQWRDTPPPVRGELVRRYGEKLRRHKEDLATVVTHEAGKIRPESLGEVQEMIDICDFAVGQSRMLYGRTIASERPSHRLMEQWHPLGPICVISAFNFPVAVWAWNAALAWICGDPVIWKPSEKTPLSALACQSLLEQVVDDMDEDIFWAVSSVIIGDADVGHTLAESKYLPLVSATGSIPMGRSVAKTVAARLGRSLLELGGNNGMIVCPSADLELAVRSIIFAAFGTCGQRCTSLRRLIVHESVYDEIRDRLLGIIKQLRIGDPTDADTLVGPLIDERAFDGMNQALDAAREQGGQIHGGGRLTSGVPAGGFYVRPALVEISADADILQHETFAPLMYLLKYTSLDEAIRIHNDVPQGLASAIFTSDVREAERFLAPGGSDCGITNVNIGTSGAEIGGAFGGEKETGGGRESGSDCWKAYMRRTTNTINYGDQLPLAQGVKFDV